MRPRWYTCVRTAGVLALLAPATASGQKAERKYFMSFDDDVISGSVDGALLNSLGTRRMRRANRIASRILERRMRRKRPSDLKLIRQAGAADVVVVKGSYDRVQDVLRAVKIKHVVIPPRLVSKIPLMSLQTVMLNCPGRLNRAGQKKLKRFVKTGGYLVTTDWALTTVEKIFPGYVTRGGRNTRNDVVRVHIHEGNPLLAHVRAGKDHPRWWLEASSYPIRVLDRKRVTVLISSKQMARKYGHAPIAVAFRYDDGRVMHMTSHFYLQQAKLHGRRERAKGSNFAAAAGLKKDAIKKLRQQGLDKVRAGALNSAYSMQQVTANVLMDKARANARLLKRFNRRAIRPFSLRTGPRRGAPAIAGPRIGKTYLLMEVRTSGLWALVRDLFGREGWAERRHLKVGKADTHSK